MPCRWDAVWRAAQETSAAAHSQAPPQKESSWQFLSVPSGGWICWASLLALASSHGGGLKFFIPGKGPPSPEAGGLSHTACPFSSPHPSSAAGTFQWELTAVGIQDHRVSLVLAAALLKTYPAALTPLGGGTSSGPHKHMVSKASDLIFFFFKHSLIM